MKELVYSVLLSRIVKLTFETFTRAIMNPILYANNLMCLTHWVKFALDIIHVILHAVQSARPPSRNRTCIKGAGLKISRL